MPILFLKINEVLSHFQKIPHSNYSLSYFKHICKSPMVVDHKNRIIIDLLNSNKESVISGRKRKFKSKQFHYFYIIKNEDATEVLARIKCAMKKEEYKLSTEKYQTPFLKKCAAELNKNIPKSEQWFRAKIEKEPFFKDFDFQYNEILMGFIYDLFSKKYRVAIEVDGTWHDRPDQKARDIHKEDLIVQKCWTILRVKANDESSYKTCIRELTSIINKTSSARSMDKVRKKLEAKMIKRHF